MNYNCLVPIQAIYGPNGFCLLDKKALSPDGMERVPVQGKDDQIILNWYPYIEGLFLKKELKKHHGKIRLVNVTNSRITTTFNFFINQLFN